MMLMKNNTIRHRDQRKELTKAQKKVVSALVKFILEEGYQPSMEELAKILDLNPSGIHHHLRGIALSGWIYLTGAPRSIIIPKDVIDDYTAILKVKE